MDFRSKPSKNAEQWSYEKCGVEDLKLQHQESMQHQADQVYECVPWTEYKHRAFNKEAKIYVPQIRRVEGDFKYEKFLFGPPPANTFHYHLQDWTWANRPQSTKNEVMINNKFIFGEAPKYDPYKSFLPESTRVVGFTHINPCIRQPTYLQSSIKNTTLTPEDFQCASNSTREIDSQLGSNAGQRSRWDRTAPYNPFCSNYRSS